MWKLCKTGVRFPPPPFTVMTENFISNIICELNELLDTPLSEDVRSDLIDVIGDLKDQDPHQYWGERGEDY